MVKTGTAEAREISASGPVLEVNGIRLRCYQSIENRCIGGNSYLIWELSIFKKPGTFPGALRANMRQRRAKLLKLKVSEDGFEQDIFRIGLDHCSHLIAQYDRRRCRRSFRKVTDIAKLDGGRFGPEMASLAPPSSWKSVRRIATAFVAIRSRG